MMPLACDEGQIKDSVEANSPAQLGFTRPVSDVELARSSGKAAFVLTVGNFIQLADGQTRQAFRVAGEIARTEMDVWWGTTGAELIASSVRAASMEPK